MGNIFTIDSICWANGFKASKAPEGYYGHLIMQFWKIKDFDYNQGSIEHCQANIQCLLVLLS